MVGQTERQSRSAEIKSSRVVVVQSLEEEEKMTKEQLAIKNVGKQDPKRHLGDAVSDLLQRNILQGLASQIDAESFK